jgi:hypothetical protein
MHADRAAPWSKGATAPCLTSGNARGRHAADEVPVRLAFGSVAASIGGSAARISEAVLLPRVGQDAQDRRTLEGYAFLLDGPGMAPHAAVLAWSDEALSLEHLCIVRRLSPPLPSP